MIYSQLQLQSLLQQQPAAVALNVGTGILTKAGESKRDGNREEPAAVVSTTDGTGHSSSSNMEKYLGKQTLIEKEDGILDALCLLQSKPFTLILI